METHPTPRIEQALHGYDHGHRLLAASATLSAEALRLMDRLSDAAGTTGHPDEDGYLTGYPLPDGRYALARTWPAWEIPRPNCVWTHTLVLTKEHLVDDADVGRWPALLRRPDGDLKVYEAPVADARGRTKGRVPTAAQVDEPTRTAICTSLYGSDDGLAWAESGDPSLRDELALAVWAQLWPALRRRFAFCSGALEPRQAGARAFDLCLVPPASARAFRAAAPSVPGAQVGENVTRWLAYDLAQPSPPFRQFLAFVAGGSTRRTTIASLANVWVSLTDATEPQEALAAAVREITKIGPRPDQARRLKRALFRLPESPMLRLASPVDVFTILTTGPLAASVTPSDATLGSWAGLAWAAAPDRVLSFVATQTPNETRQLVEQVVEEQASPPDLPRLASSAPALLWRVLARNTSDDAWWTAFAALDAEAIAEAARVAPQGEAATLSRAAAALVGDGSDIADRWRLLAAAVGAEAVMKPTVAALTKRRPISEQWRDALGAVDPNGEHVLRHAESSVELAVAAEVVEPTPVVLGRGLTPWDGLSERDVASLRRGLAVLFLASVASPQTSDPAFTGRVYGELYRRLAVDEAADEWAVLRARLKGSPDDWDRCKRLARTLAKALRSSGSRRVDLVVAHAAREDGAAAARLVECLEEPPPKRKLRIFGIEIG